VWGCEIPKIELDGLPVIDAPDGEEIKVAVSADDVQVGNEKTRSAARWRLFSD
jgi:hypothetical protein